MTREEEEEEEGEGIGGGGERGREGEGMKRREGNPGVQATHNTTHRQTGESQRGGRL